MPRDTGERQRRETTPRDNAKSQSRETLARDTGERHHRETTARDTSERQCRETMPGDTEKFIIPQHLVSAVEPDGGSTGHGKRHGNRIGGILERSDSGVEMLGFPSQQSALYTGTLLSLSLELNMLFTSPYIPSITSLTFHRHFVLHDCQQQIFLTRRSNLSCMVAHSW
ncbi:hypothetical protein DAT39_023476 [Clarias magur]|uniref:Uncharacterized protein n=1 Tax=Clarias magur TaxID=1594786 RepID=A0A8J4T0C3_CLAMG|nr:hypothetical protein DAT39_023476 [Clarias magur]